MVKIHKKEHQVLLYIMQELLGGKTFKVQSGENYKSKDTYKVISGGQETFRKTN